MADRPFLRKLAADLGIVAEFRGTDGIRRVTTDATRVALLHSMGIDASGEAESAAAWRSRQRAQSAAVLAPVQMHRHGRIAALHVTVPAALRKRGNIAWSVDVRTEAGEQLHASGECKPGPSVRLALPSLQAEGFHRLRLRLETAAGRAEGEQLLIIVPRRCVAIDERIAVDRAFGICANLYSVRDGRADFGDLTTLSHLCTWAGRAGAAFVGVNPLNAIRACGGEVSPYSPTTRAYRSDLYLDVEAIPEMSASRTAQRLAAATDPGAAVLDYDAIAKRKRRILRLLYDVFRRVHAREATARGKAFRRFVAAGGDGLHGFATFCALDEHFGTASGGTLGWRDWPATYCDPQGAAVGAFVRKNSTEIDFHRYVQFEIDRQLGRVESTARRAGLALGLYQDLPIGAVPSGCEEWLHQDLFCRDASIGAPPDAFFAGGQNWGLAPLNPAASAAARFEFWGKLLRAAFARAGVLRIDHVMGLARQYWIPHGLGAGEGAYVRMPADELFGILALESRRAGAIVVGEDLGTVPEEIPPLLRRWGVLSTKVLYFEQQQDGRFRRSIAYPKNGFVSANTHDLATLAGFAVERDLDLNERAGILEDGDALQQTRVARREALAQLRRQTGATPGESLLRPVHEHLASSRAALLGVALDDLGGEVDPVNLPGVGEDRYPSWRRRMQRSLTEIAGDAEVRATLESLRALRPLR